MARVREVAREVGSELAVGFRQLKTTAKKRFRNPKPKALAFAVLPVGFRPQDRTPIKRQLKRKKRRR